MRPELRQEMALDGAISLMSSNSLQGQKVHINYIVFQSLSIN